MLEDVSAAVVLLAGRATTASIAFGDDVDVPRLLFRRDSTAAAAVRHHSSYSTASSSARHHYATSGGGSSAASGGASASTATAPVAYFLHANYYSGTLNREVSSASTSSSSTIATAFTASPFTSALTELMLLMVNATTGLPATTPSPDQSFTKAWSTSEMVEMIYQMMLFFVGTPINAVALVKFSRSSRRSSSSELRLMRLSRQLLIAHLMVLCIYCVWRTYWFYNIAWTQGNLLCKLYSFLTALPFHLWSNMVAAIAVDMLYCISVPLKSVQNGNKRVTWLIGAAWTCAIGCSAPMAVFRGTVKIPNTEFEQCYALVEDFDNDVLMAFHFFHVFTTFYVPLAIIVLCYLIIGTSLRTQMAERKSRLGGGYSIDQARRCHNVTMRFLLVSACIVFTFVLTWLPYQVMALLRVICRPNSACERFVSKCTWLQAILIASTCINPFLYKFGIFKSKARRNVSGACTYNNSFAATVGPNVTAAYEAGSGCGTPSAPSSLRQSVRSASGTPIAANNHAARGGARKAGGVSQPQPQQLEASLSVGFTGTITGSSSFTDGRSYTNGHQPHHYGRQPTTLNGYRYHHRAGVNGDMASSISALNGSDALESASPSPRRCHSTATAPSSLQLVSLTSPTFAAAAGGKSTADGVVGKWSATSSVMRNLRRCKDDGGDMTAGGKRGLMAGLLAFGRRRSSAATALPKDTHESTAERPLLATSASEPKISCASKTTTTTNTDSLSEHNGSLSPTTAMSLPTSPSLGASGDGSAAWRPLVPRAERSPPPAPPPVAKRFQYYRMILPNYYGQKSGGGRHHNLLLAGRRTSTIPE